MRVKFQPGQQRAFIEEVLRLTGVSTTTLADRIGVCGRTVRDWRREKWQMDGQSLDRLCQLASLPRPSGIAFLPEHWSVEKASRLGGLRRFERYGALGTLESRRRGGLAVQARLRRDPHLAKKWRIVTRKTIQQPEHSVSLAEFVGIFLGDGGFRNAWQIAISYNPHLDRPYADFIYQLIERLFGIEPVQQFLPARGSGDVVVSSIALVEFLETTGIRRGRKRVGFTTVPRWIQEELGYRKACLRGLMDTDGCVFQHRYRVNGAWYAYPKLAFAGTIPALCQFVKETLGDLGILAYYDRKRHRVWVHSHHSVVRYFALVGTHNPRYRERYEKYIGEVPKGSHGGGLLNRCTGEIPYRGFESLPLRHY